MELTLHKKSNYLSSQELARQLDREHRYLVSQLYRMKQDMKRSSAYGDDWCDENMIEQKTPHARNGLPSTMYLLTRQAALLYAERLRPVEMRKPLENTIIKSFNQ